MMNKKRGFTISELLITMFIMFMVLASLMTFYIMTQYLWKEGDVYMKLQQKARLAMEKMVRGVTGTNGIMEAASVELPAVTPSNSKIIFKDSQGNVNGLFYLSDNQLIYKPNEASSGIQIIKSNVKTLEFTKDGVLVAITLGMEEEVKGKPLNVVLATQIKLRNASEGEDEDEDEIGEDDEDEDEGEDGGDEEEGDDDEGKEKDKKKDK